MWTFLVMKVSIWFQLWLFSFIFYTLIVNNFFWYNDVYQPCLWNDTIILGLYVLKMQFNFFEYFLLILIYFLFLFFWSWSVMQCISFFCACSIVVCMIKLILIIIMQPSNFFLLVLLTVLFIALGLLYFQNLIRVCSLDNWSSKFLSSF